MISNWGELPELNEIQKPHNQTRKAQTRKFLFYVLFYVLFLIYLILDFVAFQNELLIRTSSIPKNWFRKSRDHLIFWTIKNLSHGIHGVSYTSSLGGQLYIVKKSIYKSTPTERCSVALVLEYLTKHIKVMRVSKIYENQLWNSPTCQIKRVRQFSKTYWQIK